MANHQTQEELYGADPIIAVVIQERRTRCAGHCFRSTNELVSEFLLWNPTHGKTLPS